MTTNNPDNGSILGLDVGSRRIGVALVSLSSLLPRPLITLNRSENTFHDIQKIVEENGVRKIIVGLPRSLDGNITQQTRDTRTFIKELTESIEIPIIEQDEALTSHQAEAELISRARPYTKSDIDSLAATYILQDYLSENKVAGNV